LKIRVFLFIFEVDEEKSDELFIVSKILSSEIVSSKHVKNKVRNLWKLEIKKCKKYISLLNNFLIVSLAIFTRDLKVQ
jgi:hypothetical protein